MSTFAHLVVGLCVLMILHTFVMLYFKIKFSLCIFYNCV